MEVWLVWLIWLAVVEGCERYVDGCVEGCVGSSVKRGSPLRQTTSVTGWSTGANTLTHRLVGG